MKHLFAAFSLLAPTSPALAHAGDHHHFDLWAAIAHLATQPFHVAMIVAALGVGILLARRRRSSKATSIDMREQE